MAGGASADPPPFWLIIITVAIFVGFLIAYNATLPTVSLSNFSCTGSTLFTDCATSVVVIIGEILVFLFTVLTLGGFASPLPILIQVPLFFFFAITWGIIIVKMITNTAGAVIP